MIFKESFSFDEKVSGCFDDMLSRSVPDYSNMRALVHSVGANFAGKGDTVVDLGSSLGRAYGPFAMDGANVISCEVSKNMVERQRALYGDLPNVDIRHCDITSDYPRESADLVLCVLTLQFLPVEERQRLVANMSASLKPGGAAIVVEKLLGGSADIESLMVREHYRAKAANGYTPDQVESKRRALVRVMAPLTESANREMLLSNGFSHVECFWRHLNFAAFLAVRP